MGRSKLRVYQLDLLRFIAAFGVLMYHYTFLMSRQTNFESVKFPYLEKVFKYGYLGFDLFFMISGFVILMSLAKGGGVLGFLRSRISRLYPAYWFGLSLTAFVVVVYGKPLFEVSFFQYFVNLTMFQGFAGIKNIDGVYWTLLVELKFYFIISLMFFLTKGRIEKLEKYLILWTTLTFLKIFVDFHSNIFLRLINFSLILDYSSYFISGMYLYLTFQRGRKIKYDVIIIINLFLSIFLALQGADLIYSKDFLEYAPYLLIVLITSFFVIMYLISYGKLQWLNQKIWLGLGLLTYPLYLIHQNIGYVLFYKFDIAFGKYSTLIAVFCLMIFLSYLINRFIEQPFGKHLRLKFDRVLESQRIQKLLVRKILK